jgi:hypothetical protein
MSTHEQASPWTMRSIGIGMAIGGIALILIGLDVLPVPGGRDVLHAPLWIVLLIGIAVLLAGAAIVIQGVGRANAAGDLPADAPRWMRIAQYLIGVALFALFAMVGTWVALAGDARQFSGGVPLLGTVNVSLARIVFGLGALICWLAVIGYGIAGARKLMSGGDSLR